MKFKFLVYAIAILIMARTLVGYADPPKETLSDLLNALVDNKINILTLKASVTYIKYDKKTDKKIIKLSRAVVTENFKNSDSAKFQNERVIRKKLKYENDEKNGIYICGEVNGKNSYGAYVGYRGYFASYDTVFFEPDEFELDESKPDYYRVYHYFCSDKK